MGKSSNTQAAVISFKLLDSDGATINEVVSTTPVMSPESAAEFQSDMLGALKGVHDAWRKKKFGS